jgi:hypothetical protein
VSGNVEGCVHIGDALYIDTHSQEPPSGNGITDLVRDDRTISKM